MGVVVKKKENFHHWKIHEEVELEERMMRHELSQSHTQEVHRYRHGKIQHLVHELNAYVELAGLDHTKANKFLEEMFEVMKLDVATHVKDNRRLKKLTLKLKGELRNKKAMIFYDDEIAELMKLSEHFSPIYQFENTYDNTNDILTPEDTLTLKRAFTDQWKYLDDLAPQKFWFSKTHDIEESYIVNEVFIHHKNIFGKYPVITYKETRSNSQGDYNLAGLQFLIFLITLGVDTTIQQLFFRRNRLKN